ncbi:MAG: hypothetical protein V4587_17830 [Acidobacteriota bacterium]
MRSYRLRWANFPLSLVLVLLAAVSALSLAGCDGNTLHSPTILSPGPDAVTSLPVTIRLAMNGETLSQLKIELDGIVITSDFTVSNGVATATIQDGVFVGDNRLSVTAAELPPVLSTFSYAPPAPPGLSAPQPPATVHIQTQVQTTNPNGQKTNGVEVGQTIYANQGPATDWQLLLLSRINLSPIANKHYTLTPSQEGNYDPLDQLIADISPVGSLLKSCGQPGCLMVLEGPVNNAGFSPYPCGSAGGPSDAIECSLLAKALTAIGATPTSTFISDSSGAGYSFIGNVGSTTLNAGVNFERITCSNSNGCLSLPVPAANDSNSEFVNGIAPNGVDGIIPTLAGTSDNGTTAILATPNSPAMTVNNNGAMSGLLVADNNNNYTFSYAAPPIRFQMGPAPENPNKHIVILQLPAASSMKFPNGQSTMEAESAQLPASQIGGFHLVVWDATTFKNLLNDTYVTNPAYCPNTCQSPDGTTIFSLALLPSRLQLLRSRGNIWFLGSIGDLSHNFPATITSPSYQMQDVWDRVAQSVQDLGGTYSTFAMLDNPAMSQNNWDQYSKNKIPTDDDYNMVGQLWINPSGVPNPYAAEASRAISRQTSLYPVAGNMQGVLEKGNDGFYVSVQHSQYAGVVPVAALDFFNASYLPSVPWPLTGPNDLVGPKNAYQWISEQLLQCISGCGDIRSAYTNLNLTPSLWYSALSNLQPPGDCSQPNNPCGFTDTDFAVARTQLLQELDDLTALRALQNNMVTSAIAEEPDFNSLLTAAGNNVLANIPYTTTLKIGANTTNDVLNVVGAASGFFSFIPVVGGGISAGVRTGIGLYELLSDDGTTVNDPNGVSLKQQEQDFSQISKLADARANQYAESIASIGTAFNRIVSDWGRMQTAAMPVINNTLQFDDQALGQYLTGFNLETRRSLYAALMPLNYYAVHYRYADPGLNGDIGFQPGWLDITAIPLSVTCDAADGLPKLLANNPQSYGFWAGALIDGPGATLQTSTGGSGNAYPFDAWWDLWFVGQKQSYDNFMSQNGGLEGNSPGCPTESPGTFLPSASFFNATELFTPIGTDANALGLYKPWFLGRGSLVRLHAVGTDTDLWKDLQNHGRPHVYGSNWAPDPDNY